MLDKVGKRDGTGLFLFLTSDTFKVLFRKGWVVWSRVGSNKEWGGVCDMGRV